MNIELGYYDTEEEAAYAYNVAMKLTNPFIDEKELNRGMNLTKEQMDKIDKEVTQLIRREFHHKQRRY